MRISVALAPSVAVAHFFALGLGALLSVPVAATAQESCICEVSPGTDSLEHVASLEEVGGEVLLAGARGYTPVQSQVDLSVGDRVVLLRDGWAILDAGPACRFALTAESMISLTPSPGGVCIAQALTAPGQAQFAATHLPGLVVSGSLIATGVLGGIFSDAYDEDSVSP